MEAEDMTENTSRTVLRSTVLNEPYAQSSSFDQVDTCENERSVPSTATSTTDTIGSTEEVHNYDEWEILSEISYPIPEMDGTLPSIANTTSSTNEYSESNNSASYVMDCSTGVLACSLRDNVELSSSPYSAEAEDSDFDTEDFDGYENFSCSSAADPDVDGEKTSYTTRTLDETTVESEDVDVPSPHNDSLSKSENLAASKNPLIDSSREAPATTAVPHRIQVLVRVRPMLKNDHKDDAVVTNRGDSPNSIQVKSSCGQGGQTFITECTFDRVFMDTATQEDIFDAVTPCIHSSLLGFNATVFAYGQTGTGKTHTIFGEDVDVSSIVSGFIEPIEGAQPTMSPSCGIIPRAIAYILHQASIMRKQKVSVELRCSFMQIYNDRLFDLLTDRKRQKPLIIREQPTLEGTTNVILQGLSSEPIMTLFDALQILRRGRANRAVRETESNAASSRSHAIVQLTIVTENLLVNGDKCTRKSRLNLVDLAGSEKWNTDIEMEDMHSQELKNINTSLSALGNCIAALAKVGRKHIPYRDSTLTRLLQDSFGGNTQSYLIATIASSQRACDETIRTLQFADRARSVMQTVRVNESISGSTELIQAKAQIAKLKERLEKEKRKRHETRLKEHEALQRDFMEKLKGKDKEILKLSRDNAVFIKWRDEDLIKIRALDSRVRELESSLQQAKGRTDLPLEQSIPVVPETNEQPIRQRSNQDTENCKSLPSQKSYSKPKITKEAVRKEDNSAQQSYKQLLERYAMSSKNGKRTFHVKQHQSALPQQQQCDNTQPAAIYQRIQIWHSGNQLHNLGDFSTQNGDKCSLPSDSDSKSTGRNLQNLVDVPNSSTVAMQQSPKTLAIHNNILSVPERNHHLVHLSPVRRFSIDHIETNQTQGAITPITTGVLAPALVPKATPEYRDNGNCLPNLTHPTNAVIPRQPIWETNDNHDNLTPVATDVPNVLSRSSNIDRVVPNQVTSTLVFAGNLANAACEKHRLKGCVLCVIKDNRQPTLSIKDLSNTFSEARNLEPSKAAEGPCDRHRLTNCFICGKFSTTSRLVAANTSVPSSTNISAEGSHTECNSLLMGESKCALHSLANCVLCARVVTMAKNIQQESLTQSRFPQESTEVVSTMTLTQKPPLKSCQQSGDLDGMSNLALSLPNQSNLPSHTAISPQRRCTFDERLFDPNFTKMSPFYRTERMLKTNSLLDSSSSAESSLSQQQAATQPTLWDMNKTNEPAVVRRSIKELVELSFGRNNLPTALLI